MGLFATPASDVLGGSIEIDYFPIEVGGDNALGKIG